ncbi:MAG TPA: hypothetical protein VFB29_12575 [Pseudolabrys sp.]|nr:hypothetical protein [Pseudolabrys sp.]
MAEQASGETSFYAYRPSLFGAPREFSLTGGGIDWTAGGRAGSIPFARIRRLRLSYRPTSMQSQRFVAELWADGCPKLQIVSSSWKSMMEQERLDGAYSAFIRELHRRIRATNAAAEFQRGSNPLIYWPGVLIFVAAAFGLAGLIARAVQAGALASAAIVGAFLVLYLWQAGNFFRRNRPGTYRPDDLPADVMPRE